MMAGNISPIMEPDKNAMTAFVEHLFGSLEVGAGLVELAWTDAQPDASGRHKLRHAQLFPLDRLEALIELAATRNRIPGCNVYVGMNLRHIDTMPGARSDDADAVLAVAVAADLDEPGVISTARQRYGDDKPTFVVKTGAHPHSRAQIWWKLKEPTTDMDRWTALMKGIAAAVHGDPTITNPGRVMRLAGSVAWPVKEGRVRELTSVVPLQQPGPQAFPLESLEAIFPPVASSSTAAGAIALPRASSLGITGKITDGRERYMRDTVLACLIEFIGTNGAVPEPQELFDAAWPQYQRNVDFTRDGRGPEEVADKCRVTIKRFEEGRIAGLETIDRALEVYADKVVRRAEASSSASTATTEARDELASEPFAATDFTGAPPVREWLVKDWIPKGTVTALYGDGGVGKTLIAQQLAYAAAIGGNWLGFDVPKMRALCVFCEDDRDELHRRHDSIKASLGHPMGNPFSDVWVWPRVGHDNLLVTFDKDSRPSMSTFFEGVMRHVLEKRIDTLFLDTVADLYGGNEIVRAQVNFFIKAVCGAYIRKAQEAGWSLTVIILAHPSQAGKNTGSGESGSTAWSNAVRSRLYLTRPEEGLAEERILTRKKSNYSASGDDVKLSLLWQDGVIIRPVAGNGSRNEKDERLAIDSAKRQVKMLVADAWRRGQPYKKSKDSTRFLNRCVAEQLTARGVTIGAVLGALNELIGDGEIENARTGKKRGYRVNDDAEDDE